MNMTNQDFYNLQLKEHFKVSELVCNHAYNKFGDYAINFLDIKLLETLACLRRLFDLPITINSHSRNLKQRGLRCNICDITLKKSSKRSVYISAHLQGKAIDFNVRGLDDQTVRDMIENWAEELPHPIRLEKGTKGWVHLDVRATSDEKCSYF